MIFFLPKLDIKSRLHLKKKMIFTTVVIDENYAVTV